MGYGEGTYAYTGQILIKRQMEKKETGIGFALFSPPEIPITPMNDILNSARTK